jgi:hypothetical protein
MDAMGIRLGMTVSEARALVVPQGGEIRRTLPQNHNRNLKLLLEGGVKEYFEYMAAPTPLPKQQTAPRSRLAADFEPVKHPDFYVTLYVYPRSRGAWDDPDNLVIYALRTSRAYGRRKRPFGIGTPAEVANMPSVTLEEFLRRMAGSYGPVREVITGGDSQEFALLPDVQSGQSYSAAELKAAPRDNNKARADTTSCSYMGHKVHKLYQLNLRLSRDQKTSSLIGQQGLAGFNRTDLRLAPEAYAAWGECGEVIHIQAILNRQNMRRVEQINLFRYSRDYYERALKAFATR